MIDWKEADLFNWLKENTYPDLVKSKNPLSCWDCYSPIKKHRIELKCRKKHYDTMLLEKKKYDAMILECEKHLDVPVYINSTPQGIFIWDLLQLKPKWEVNYLNPATTHFNNTQRIKKEVTYLTLENKLK